MVEKKQTALSGKGPFVLAFLVLLITSIFLFAKFEFIDNVPVHEKIIAEGKSPYFEAFYWLITTTTTVGYGDYTPVTQEGKILTIFVMMIGVSFLGFLLSSITQSIVSSNLRDVFGISMAKKRIDLIICGWNELSQAAYKELGHRGYNTMIIDEGPPPGMIDKYAQYIRGSPKESSVLEKAGIRKAKHAILCLDKDSDVLLILHLIRRLNPWIDIVAKIDNYEHIKLAEHAGADQVVSTSSITGRLLSIATEEPYVVRWVLNATTSAAEEEFNEYKITRTSSLNEKTVGEAEAILRKARILGLMRQGRFERFPPRSYKLIEGDKLLLMSAKKVIRQWT
jgi:voltage-gated potassium channel